MVELFQRLLFSCLPDDDVEVVDVVDLHDVLSKDLQQWSSFDLNVQVWKNTILSQQCEECLELSVKKLKTAMLMNEQAPI